jgi:hypothetical protein
MAFTILNGGSFTSTGVGVKIPVSSSADYFRTWNITQLGLTGTVAVGGEWFGPKFGAGATPANDGLRWRKAGTSAILIDNFSTATASPGFTYVTSVPVVEAQAPNAITAGTAANPMVVSQVNTYSNGDLVRIYNTTGDLTLGGMVFQISSVSGTGYTLLGLPGTAANGFTAITAGFTRRVSQFAAVDPEYLYVTNISPGSVASPAIFGSIISTTVDPSNYYVVGMKVKVTVPAGFGMIQMNQLTGTITAINVAATTNTSAYNVVVDIDSSAFNAFVFPASALSPTAPLFATIAPAGAQTSFNPVTGVQTGYNFLQQPFHTGQFVPYMFLGAGAASPAGVANDVINWMSYKLET